jgi:crotonobetainyl-CoA:carnitine CoA-transferase CaiB-like acyl-CoA transferase
MGNPAGLDKMYETLPASDPPQALRGVRVLDLSRWVSGEFCTKLFGDFGSDVIKVERPGEGSLTRRYGPFPSDVPNSETSALFLHLNTNKRSVTLDLASPTGRELLLELVRSAHLVVESFRPGCLERLGLGPDAMREVNPEVVVVRISAFGQTGPYREYEATGLTLQAAGWPMNATGAADHPPHRKPGLLEHYTVGRMAAEAALAGLFAARKFRRGSIIDVSAMETLLSGADRRASYLLTAAYSGTNAPRGIRSAHRSGATLTGPYRCKDGYVMLYVTNQAFWNRLVDLVAGEDEAFRSLYSDRFALKDSQEFEEFYTRVSQWFAARPKLVVMEQGEHHRIPLTAFLEVPEVFENDHFRDRGCFVEGNHPVVGSLEYLGPPWRMEAGWRLRRTAPLLGGDTEEVLSEVGIGTESLRALRGQGII